MKHVIKQSSKVQTFNSKKLASSIKATLVSNQYPPEKAKNISDEVVKEVVDWLGKKTEVTSLDIRNQAAKQLAKYDKNVAFMYKKHKDLW